MQHRQTRALSTFLYMIGILFAHYSLIGSGFPLNEKLLWLVSGVASLLLGSRLINPHFTPPADSATNSFFAGTAMLAALATDPALSIDRIIIWTILGYCIAVLSCALVVLVLKKPQSVENRFWVITLEKIANGCGAPKLIFTIIILSLAFLFHRESVKETFVILTVWTVIVAIDPVESIINFINWSINKMLEAPRGVLGVVAAYQNPGLALIRQSDDKRYSTGTLMALSDDQGPTRLGVALNYVGRDEGNLLRVLSLPIPAALKTKVENVALGGSTAVEFQATGESKREILVLDRINSLCGIIDVGSSLESIEIEITNEAKMAEGRLVEVKIDRKPVIYQITEGITHEDSVLQKNKYGYVRARARKIGIWDTDDEKFSNIPWVPKMNSPVFLLSDDEEVVPTKHAIGHFPKTNFNVSLDLSAAVTHNTAILGILGIGKSFLAIELVERMIAEGVKVICLDLTDQYAGQLEQFYSATFNDACNQNLTDAARGRPVKQGKEAGGSIHAFNAQVKNEVENFLADGCEETLRIINPANFRVSKQTTNAYQNSAAFSDLTPSEITAIISSQVLSACQTLGMTDQARVCLIFEEAHTLVPEWNSVASDGDKNATAATARAILQGRKFGLGCLLITQRTANVTKTILNQCNTIFAMRTFDDTGKDFLGNYIGRDYAGILPSLPERHAVVFGKASSCDQPVMLRLNDRDKFLAAFYNASDQTDEAPD